ncbi:MAG: alpha/beta hydrolase [Bacteroidales bacterium]|nr:alpha/beta hydrolase [Bacteroidales bacterium]
MSSPTTGIVFLHGAGLRSSIWDDIKPLISLPAIYAEFPGREQYAHSNCALSLEDYSKTVINQIKELNTDRIVLVVHSISGILGLKIAETFKSRLAGFYCHCCINSGKRRIICFLFFVF